MVPSCLQQLRPDNTQINSPYPDGVVPGSVEAPPLLKLADEFPPVKLRLTQGDHIPSGLYARRAFVPIEVANVDYADKVYKRFKF